MKMRLAFRVEEDWWVAYIAQPDSMDGAVQIGLIPFRIVQDSEEVKQGFMDLMKDAAAVGFAAIGGAEIEGWDGPVKAPEEER